LWRKIQDDEIWLSPEPFNKRDAWIDLLLMTWAKDKDFIIGKKVVRLKAGQIFLSYRFLGTKWHWSKHKIGDYLSLLRDLKKIEFEARPEGTLITICNWEIYQSIFDVEGTQTNSERGRSGDEEGTLRGQNKDCKRELEIDKEKDIKDGVPPKDINQTKGIKSVDLEDKLIFPIRAAWTSHFGDSGGFNWGLAKRLLRGENSSQINEPEKMIKLILLMPKDLKDRTSRWIDMCHKPSQYLE